MLTTQCYVYGKCRHCYDYGNISVDPMQIFYCVMLCRQYITRRCYDPVNDVIFLWFSGYIHSWFVHQYTTYHLIIYLSESMPSNTIVYMLKLQQIHHTPLISKIITTNNAFFSNLLYHILNDTKTVYSNKYEKISNCFRILLFLYASMLCVMFVFYNV